jgi:uncharacterized protein (DUF488 family)
MAIFAKNLPRNQDIVEIWVEMKVSIEVHDQVIFRRFSGLVSIEDMIESWKEIFSRYGDLSAYKGIITSFLNADTKSHGNNLNRMVEYLKEYVDQTRGIKVAIVMDTPKVTSTIIMNQKMKHMHIKLFSSEEAALEWINA